MDITTRNLTQSMLIAVSAYMEEYPETGIKYLALLSAIASEFINHSESYNQKAITNLYSVLVLEIKEKKGTV